MLFDDLRLPTRLEFGMRVPGPYYIHCFLPHLHPCVKILPNMFNTFAQCKGID